jgi:hypothetical protein
MKVLITKQLHANSPSVTQDISHLSQKPNVHHHVHKSLPLISTLSQMNSIHTPESHFFKEPFSTIFITVLILHYSERVYDTT